MQWVEIGFAFSAGIVAFFSPCAFPMLPAYISYYLSRGQKGVKSGIIGGLACGLGAILVLNLIGILVSFAGEEIGGLIKEHITVIEIAVSIIIIILGVSMILGKTLSFSLPLKKTEHEGYTGLFLYGVLYALAALGCTAPIFISIMLRAFSSFDILNGLLISFVYSLGLTVFLVMVTFILALGKEVLVKKMRKILPYVEKIGGIIIVLVGLYILLYTFY